MRWAIDGRPDVIIEIADSYRDDHNLVFSESKPNKTFVFPLESKATRSKLDQKRVNYIFTEEIEEKKIE